MIQLKKDLIIQNHDGSFTTYPKGIFEIKPRISVVVDEDINIELRIALKDGTHRNTLGNLRFTANSEDRPYAEAAKQLDNGRLTDNGVKWLREQSIPNIDLKQFI